MLKKGRGTQGEGRLVPISIWNLEFWNLNLEPWNLEFGIWNLFLNGGNIDQLVV